MTGVQTCALPISTTGFVVFLAHRTAHEDRIATGGAIRKAAIGVDSRFNISEGVDDLVRVRAPRLSIDQFGILMRDKAGQRGKAND